jgi:hypothetical protein
VSSGGRQLPWAWSSKSSLKVDNAVAEGDSYGMGSVTSAELLNGHTDVFIDGSLADVKNLANLPSRLASRHPAQNFDFTSRESRQF